jgi:hypothetical protein
MGPLTMFGVAALAQTVGDSLGGSHGLPIVPYWGEPVTYYTAWDDGVLNWNRWDGVTSTHTWTDGFPPNPSEYGEVTSVIPAGGTSVFVRWDNGALDWYRHDGFASSADGWTGPVRVGSGWDVFVAIAGGGQGVVYGLTADGSLYWYKYDAYLSATGPYAWRPWTLVRTGMQAITELYGSDNGSLYGKTANGDLYYYQHLGWTTGAPTWGEAQRVGTGWNVFNEIVALPDDQLIGIRWEYPTASWWYRHQPGTTPAAWLAAIPFPYPYDEPSASGPPPSFAALPYTHTLVWALLP